MPTNNNEWKILLVDDEPDILEITAMVLEDVSYQGKPLSILLANNSQEALDIIKKNNDIALAFVDVVMETEHAGLDLIKYVRNQLNNKDIRLIIRTGNPGKAPFKEIIQHLEIDDYKEKNELTADKIETSVITSLRAYSNLIQKKLLEQSLRDILDIHNKLHNTKNKEIFFNTCLESLIDFSKKYIHKNTDSSFFVKQKNDSFNFYFGTGEYIRETNHSNNSVKLLSEDDEISKLIHEYIDTHLSCIITEDIEDSNDLCKCHAPNDYNKNHLLLSIKDLAGEVYWIGLKLPEKLSSSVLDLLNVVATHLLSTIDNAILQHQLNSAQSEVLQRLCGSVESKSKETGSHIRRVSLYSELLAKLYGLKPEVQTLIREGAPMHDIGKVGIPDMILQKNGPLTPEEWDIMKKHPAIGYELLKHDDFQIMNYGATIAYTHHEKFDGSGYPQGLSGENIPISGRIVAIADVFDALLSKRAYKNAWTFDDVVKLIQEQSGKHFDPKLVSLFLENKEDFHAIFTNNPD